MVGWWRTIYYYLGWEYPDYYDNRQQHLKHKLCEQINKTDNIKKILKTKNGKILKKKKRVKTPYKKHKTKNKKKKKSLSFSENYLNTIF